MSNFEKLSATIIARSHAQTWAEAIHEWELSGWDYVDDSACECGRPLQREFIIENVANGNAAIVGSTCVRKFMSGNKKLMVAVARAEYEMARFECRVCKTWTKHGFACAECARRAEHARQLAAQRERDRKWATVKAAIDWDKLDHVEHQFVSESVRWCIMYDRKLTDKQRAWLGRIVKKYPAAIKVQPVKVAPKVVNTWSANDESFAPADW